MYVSSPLPPPSSSLLPPPSSLLPPPSSVLTAENTFTRLLRSTAEGSTLTLAEGSESALKEGSKPAFIEGSSVAGGSIKDSLGSDREQCRSGSKRPSTSVDDDKGLFVS